MTMYEFRYSTRHSGDMRLLKNREKFLRQLTLRHTSLLIPEQVHGNKVIAVSKRQNQIQGSDGLVSADEAMVLGVLGADCVPLLFVDPKKRISGVAHAGWRGTIANITLNVIEEMKALGSSPEDIIVSVGPHIGSCCYVVPKERALKFQHMFGDEVVHEEKNHWQLDLGKANFFALTKSGITPDHIDNSPVCTSCDRNYFSYRRDSKKTFGEMLGVVIWK